MSAPDLILRSLRVRRGEHTVIDIEKACFEGGNISVIVGDNGAGKTTLLLACAGLLDLAAGEVLLGGEVFHRGRAPAPRILRRRTASAFQEPFLFAGSVRENLEFGLRCRGVARRLCAERAERAADLLDLGRLLSRSSRELSGGERKRVDLARALAVEPEVLFLDEPTLALDLDSQKRALDALTTLAEKKSTTVLLATHDAAWLGGIRHHLYKLEKGFLVKGP